MNAHTCPRCVELLDTYAVAVTDCDCCPKSVAGYLYDPRDVERCPLCPLCDYALGEYLLNDRGTVDDYLTDLALSIIAGRPMLCELCAHRGAHYALEGGGTFAFLAAIARRIDDSGAGALAHYLSGDYLEGVAP